MFTNQDYEKLQELMEQNPQTKSLLEKLFAAYQENIRAIIHEIRNPLTLVYSTLQLIEARQPEVLSFHHWESLKEDVEYMRLLLEEFSAFNNGAVLSLQKFSFRQFMEKLTLAYAASLEEKHIEYISCISPDLPSFTGDALKLKQVFLNLLKNASEAVAKGGCIRLSAFSDENCVTVKIEDNGSGMDKQTLSEIFTPFVTHKKNGTGLGLPIAKRIVEAHKGRLLAFSTPGKGSVFTVTLPI